MKKWFATFTILGALMWVAVIALAMYGPNIITTDTDGLAYIDTSHGGYSLPIDTDTGQTAWSDIDIGSASLTGDDEIMQVYRNGIGAGKRIAICDRGSPPRGDERNPNMYDALTGDMRGDESKCQGLKPEHVMRC